MQANTDGVAADAGTDTATTAVALTATMGPVPHATVVAFEVKGVLMEKVPFSCQKEKLNAYVRVYKWLGDRCMWVTQKEHSSTATALQEWKVGGVRIRGLHIKERCADNEEDACAWLVQMGVAPTAAARIAAGNLAPSSGVSPSAAASSSSSSSAAGPSHDGGEQSDAVRPAHPQAQPKRSDAWDPSSCSSCGAAVGALSALVVDDNICCDECYAALEGDVQRVDLRIGTGRGARTVGISRAAQGSGSTETKVLRLTRQWERRRRERCPGDGMVMGLSFWGIGKLSVNLINLREPSSTIFIYIYIYKKTPILFLEFAPGAAFLVLLARCFGRHSPLWATGILTRM